MKLFSLLLAFSLFAPLILCQPSPSPSPSPSDSPSVSPSPTPSPNPSFPPSPSPSSLPSPSPTPPPVPSPTPSPTPAACSNGKDSNGNPGLGFIAAALAILFFGTNYIPVKKYDPADGMFFQWVMCIGIFIVGFVTACITTPRGEPLTFYPFAMLGGFLWCTGNCMTVTVVKCIGLGMGVLVWGIGNLVMGWCTGTFGLFGTTAGKVEHPALNYVGFAFALVSMGIFAFVKPTTDDEQQEEKQSLVQIQSGHDSRAFDEITGEVEVVPDSNYNGAGIDVEGFLDRTFGDKKAYVGFAMAILMGICYGNAFTPSTRMIDHCTPENNHAIEGIDYVLSQFLGIFITSTFYFIIYAIVTKNNPAVNHRLVFPGLLSGILWAVAQVNFFIANAQLGLSVAFPLVALGPGIVASLIGIVVYKEIQGKKNLIIFGCAFAVSAVAILMIALSKFKL